MRKQYIVSLDTAGFVPPVAYDARDVLANQPSCTAFSVADQARAHTHARTHAH